LIAAGGIEIDNQVRFLRFKIRGWIVECEVAVFAYADESWRDARATAETGCGKATFVGGKGVEDRAGAEALMI
jgi:hypothetical protein